VVNIILKVTLRRKLYMEDLLWALFEKSGKIDAFLAYKDYQNTSRTLDFIIEEKNNE
jgi:hypothetical protein